MKSICIYGPIKQILYCTFLSTSLISIIIKGMSCLKIVLLIINCNCAKFLTSYLVVLNDIHELADFLIVILKMLFNKQLFCFKPVNFRTTQLV